MKNDKEITLDKFLAFIGDLDLGGQEFSFTPEMRKTHSIINEIERLIQSSEDAISIYNEIQTALAKHGEGYVYNAHGIKRSIYGRFDAESRAAIVDKLKLFTDIMSEKIGFECFLTSGTLLGLIRGGEFISYDDDFDLCYISKEQCLPNIILERLEIKHKIDALDEFISYECSGSHFHVRYKGLLAFHFDLFTAWIDKDGFLNEYPLKPGVLKANSVTPTISREFYNSLMPIPKNPEEFLLHNYGQNWRTPDPTFRFNWDECADFYSFLTNNKIAPLDNQQDFILNPSVDSIYEYLPLIPNSTHGSTDYSIYKIEALEFALKRSSVRPNIALCGLLSRELIDYLNTNSQQLGSVWLIDDENPIEKDFHTFKAGEILFNPPILEGIQHPKITTLVDKDRNSVKKLLSEQLPDNHIDILYLDTNTETKTSDYIEMLQPKLARDSIWVFDEYCLGGDIKIPDENTAFWKFSLNAGNSNRFLGRTAWSQVVVSSSKYKV